MIIKYYKNKELAYANRKRYISAPVDSDYTINVNLFTESQNSIKLGDGAITSIKTSSSHICDYVVIGNTRWFVTSYYYMNGGQVTLNLQRDVIGEFGISNYFGKIERGYTNSVLVRKKELSLNQILKERKPLKSSSNKYGNYTVNTHNNEMWGILYFSKPSDSQGNYADTLSIDISKQNIQIMDYTFIEDNTIKNSSMALKNTSIEFGLSIKKRLDNNYYNYKINIDFYNNSVNVLKVETTSNVYRNFFYVEIGPAYTPTENTINSLVGQIANSIYNSVLSNTFNGYTIPNDLVIDGQNGDLYDGVVIEKTIEGSVHYLRYTVTDILNHSYGQINLANIQYSILGTVEGIIGYSTFYDVNENALSSYINAYSYIRYNAYKFNYDDVTDEVNAGQLVLDVSSLFVDEPFFICVIPLFDVTINGTGVNRDVRKDVAFNVFNNIILKCSGENGYLVDAQIYPYCPILSSVNTMYQTTTNGVTYYVPVFNIQSTSYETSCSVSLGAYSNIKKEYMAREYAIVDTMKSSKFNFNYYDYFNSVKNTNIIIKTSLKPFSIVSAAVLERDPDSLIGISYPSNISGCVSSGGVYECSLASNAFETYARQNSNYQELFNLDKSELEYQHKVELANDIVSSVANTMSATLMGAVAGASAADIGLFNFSGTKAAGAAIGGAAAGAAVGASMAGQTIANQKLREYETYLQQQRFDLSIGTIKNLPNSVNRVSSFNEIAMSEFYYAVEIYECSSDELNIIDTFINNYSYIIGVYDLFINYFNNGWFIKGELIRSNLITNLHNIARNELAGGVYVYE